MDKQTDHIAVYKAYLHAKFDPKKTVTDVANEFGITRASVYAVVRHIEKGDPVKVKRCTSNSAFDCLWEYKYKDRLLVIPHDRKTGSVEMLRALIKDMHKEGFSVSKIASLTWRDRATVLYHIKFKHAKNK